MATTPTTPTEECKHIHLIKVLNMNPTTYECQQCKMIWDLAFNDVASVHVSFPKD